MARRVALVPALSRRFGGARARATVEVLNVGKQQRRIRLDRGRLTAVLRPRNALQGALGSETEIVTVTAERTDPFGVGTRERVLRRLVAAAIAGWLFPPTSLLAVPIDHHVPLVPGSSSVLRHPV